MIYIVSSFKNAPTQGSSRTREALLCAAPHTAFSSSSSSSIRIATPVIVLPEKTLETLVLGVSLYCRPVSLFVTQTIYYHAKF